MLDLTPKQQASLNYMLATPKVTDRHSAFAFLKHQGGQPALDLFADLRDELDGQVRAYMEPEDFADLFDCSEEECGWAIVVVSEYGLEIAHEPDDRTRIQAKGKYLHFLAPELAIYE